MIRFDGLRQPYRSDGPGSWRSQLKLNAEPAAILRRLARHGSRAAVIALALRVLEAVADRYDPTRAEDCAEFLALAVNDGNVPMRLEDLACGCESLAMALRRLAIEAEEAEHEA